MPDPMTPQELKRLTQEATEHPGSLSAAKQALHRACSPERIMALAELWAIQKQHHGEGRPGTDCDTCKVLAKLEEMSQ